VKRDVFLSARLRELAEVSGRLMEFSVAWARRLKSLKPASVRKLREGLREQSRQVGGQIGEGADFRAYESFTPGRGRTVTKVLKKTLKEKTRAERISSNPYQGGVDEILNRTKREWRDVSESPAGAHAALPVRWHKAGYVQDRMVEVDSRRRSAGRRRGEPKESFVKKINPFAPTTTQTDKGQAYRMPAGAPDSSLLTQVYTGQEGKGYENMRGRTKVTAHNIMLDPRKRKLVLTDPLGLVSF
jgi:hypothetical protein